ncbi:hypothetical protein B381_05256 [Stutzerimonas stutzeri NF13]|jgi:hypothetical protein|uniref:Uncharacterized protein n=2 Tax=Stutzerimonas TaxID=2901164 RepID=M2URE9_STUST|nr:hypothetical protein B381_05256 [Stutzerimonas stutzeri NF13]
MGGSLMNEHDERTERQHGETQPEPRQEHPGADIPEHMKPENLEKLRDYGKDAIPPGVA